MALPPTTPDPPPPLPNVLDPPFLRNPKLPLLAYEKSALNPLVMVSTDALTSLPPAVLNFTVPSASQGLFL